MKDRKTMAKVVNITWGERTWEHGSHPCENSGFHIAKFTKLLHSLQFNIIRICICLNNLIDFYFLKILYFTRMAYLYPKLNSWNLSININKLSIHPVGTSLCEDFFMEKSFFPIFHFHFLRTEKQTNKKIQTNKKSHLLACRYCRKMLHGVYWHLSNKKKGFPTSIALNFPW